jgi:hypothetical protein
MRLLDLVRRQKVAVEVSGDVLVVTMRGTGFSITYEKTEGKRLVASSFHAPKRPNEARKVTFPKFLSLAWPAANGKARGAGLDLKRRIFRTPGSARSRQLLLRRGRRFLRSFSLSERVRLNISSRRRRPSPSRLFSCLMAAAAWEKTAEKFQQAHICYLCGPKTLWQHPRA